MPIVTFSPQLFTQRYPEFNALDPVLLGLYFNEATMYCRNDGGGPVHDIQTLTAFLNMLTAHIAALNGGVNGQSATALVGRVSSASEGSVHISVEMKVPDTASWLMQTKYGAAYWEASKPYRLGGHFVAPLGDDTDIPSAFGRW